jgi:hypothetical protein
MACDGEMIFFLTSQDQQHDLFDSTEGVWTFDEV